MDPHVQPLTGAPGLARLYRLAAATALTAGITLTVAAITRARHTICPCGGPHTIRHPGDHTPNHVPAEWVTTHGTRQA